MRYAYDKRNITYTLARKMELLTLQLREHIQELLQESDDLRRDVVFILFGRCPRLSHGAAIVSVVRGDSRSRWVCPERSLCRRAAQGIECSTGSSNSTRSELDAPDPSSIGMAIPKHQRISTSSSSPVVELILTPFSCNSPSRDEHPGPPFVLETDTRFARGVS